jgi:Cu/Ag efflux protein CusF
MKNLHRLPAIAIAATAMLCLSPTAFAQRGPRRAETRGIVKSVDAAGGKITITTIEGRGGEGRPTESDKTFSLSKDVEVAIDNGGFSVRRTFFKEGKLDELSAGVTVSLTMTADEKSVESIVAEGPQIRGMLKSVDPNSKTVTVEMAPSRREEGREEKTFALAAGAEIAQDDGMGRRFSTREAKLADLSAGCSVTLRLSIDQKQVQSIFAEGPSLFGAVKSVDAGKNSITLTLPPGRGNDDSEEKTIELTKNSLVLFDDGKGRRLSVKEGKVSDILTGSFTQVRLTVDQKSVSMLRVEGQMVPGLLRAVDAVKGTITIATRTARGDDPVEKTFTVDKNIRITIEGNDAKLADLKPDDSTFIMARLTLDQKFVQSINVGRGR